MSFHRSESMPSLKNENLFLRLQAVLEELENEQIKLAEMHDDLRQLKARSTGFNVRLQSLAPRSPTKTPGSSGSPSYTKVQGKSGQPNFYAGDQPDQVEVRKFSHRCEQQSALVSSLQEKADSVRDDIISSLKPRSQGL